MLDVINEIVQTLRHNKLRTALTGFAVAWGIFMLIVLLSLAQGLVNGFDDKMLSRDTNTLTVYGGLTSKSWQGYQDGRRIKLNGRDIEPIKEDNKTYVSDVTSELTADSATVSTLTQTLSNGLRGVYPEKMQQQGGDFTITAGRFLNETDMRNMRKSIVIEESDAALLFGSPENALGKTVNSLGLTWNIVGVYSHRWWHDNFVPFTTLMSVTGNSGDVGSLTVGVQNLQTEEDGMEIEQSVRSTLARNHNFDPTDEGAVWIHNSFVGRLKAQNAMSILVFTMWAIGILTLLSGVIGVSNIMFVSVRERTHEIGIRRAIGAKRGGLLLQVVLESVAITTIFGYIGIVLGTALMALLSPMLSSFEMFARPVVDLKVAVEVTIVLIISGALAGLFPAIKATKVSPVEALRDE